MVHRKDKSYISPIDKALRQFDAEHPLSKTQLAEMNKHRRIAGLRDHKDSGADRVLSDDSIAG